MLFKQQMANGKKVLKNTNIQEDDSSDDAKYNEAHGKK